MNKNLTIFDLDHTLANCNVSFAFGKYLFQKGYFSYAKSLPLLAAYALQKAHVLSVHALHAVSFYALFSGAKVQVIEDFASDFIERHLDRLLRRELLIELECAKERGDEIWILSSSPDFLVEKISLKVNAEKTFATRYRVNADGVFSGIAEIVDGTAKWHYLEQFIDTSGLSLNQVTSYSDSILDLPLLEKVGVAIAVYPDNKLKKIARKNSWKIIS